MAPKADLEYVCKLFYDVTKVPVAVLDAGRSPLHLFPYRYLYNPVYADFGECMDRIAELLPPDRDAGAVATGLKEHYLFLKLKEEDGQETGMVVAGPVLAVRITDQEAAALSRKHRLSRSLLEAVLTHYRKVQVADFTRMKQLAMLMAYMIGGQKLEPDAEGFGVPAAPSPELAQELDASLTVNRREHFFHHSFASQNAIFDRIKDGDPTGLLAAIQSSLDGEMGILSKSSPLRNQKNIGICGAALATKSAIQGGLDSEVAYTMSDTYIRKLEELNDAAQVAALRMQMLVDFAEQVRKTKQSRYSYPVAKCEAYLRKHLLSDNPCQQVHRVLGMNPKYVGELFKKETGMTLQEFVQREKVAEAVRLLEGGGLTILDISQTLGFCDQSHFTRTFKKYAGLTPKQYVNKAKAERFPGG